MFEEDVRHIIDKKFNQHERNIMKSIIVVSTTDVDIKRVSCTGLEY
jgi:hypothetical protein